MIVFSCRRVQVPAVGSVGANDISLKMLAAPINPSDLNMVELLSSPSSLTSNRWKEFMESKHSYQPLQEMRVLLSFERFLQHTSLSFTSL
jgi:hypothetical protein